MEVIKKILTKNDCYKVGKAMTPKGIVVHDTGCNNKNVSRYLSSWNRSGVTKCVHAFIGIYDGKVSVVQTLPYTIAPWGCGKGSKGSYNSTHIQFECCEDAKNDAQYFEAVYKTAVEYCAVLCSVYRLPVSSIVDHKEAHALGYASNHGDTADWFPLFGKSMNTFRADVQAILNGHDPDQTTGIEVDGWFGKDTITKTQAVLGVPVTGQILNQPLSNRQYLPNATSGWSWAAKTYKPNDTVRAMQNLFGAEPDGYFGKQTVKAMRRYLGLSTLTSKMDKATVTAWQKWLNNH